MLKNKHYIRNAPKGGGFTGFLRQLLGLLPFLACFAVLYSVCDYVFVKNTALELAKFAEYQGEVNVPQLASGLLDLAAMLLLAYLCFYLMYMAYRKSPMFFYWGAILLFFIYPMVLLFSFYTDAMYVAGTTGEGEPSARLQALSAFVQGLNPEWSVSDSSGLLKYSAAVTLFLIVFWFLPLGFLFKRISKYNKLYKLYGDPDKPVRELTSLEYGIRRREIWWAFAGFALFTLLHFVYSVVLGHSSAEELPAYDAFLIIQNVVAAAWIISGLIFFYRIWRVIPYDISHFRAVTLLVFAFIPVLNLGAFYKFTIGVMRGMNKTFETLGWRGYKINTILAVIFWIVVFSACVAGTFFAVSVMPQGGDMSAGEFADALSKVIAFVLAALGIILILWLVLLTRMTLTAIKLLNAFEHSRNVRESEKKTGSSSAVQV